MGQFWTKKQEDHESDENTTINPFSVDSRKVEMDNEEKVELAAKPEPSPVPDDEDKDKKNEDKNAFDPYAPHKIKWWGWILLAGLIAGTIYIVKTKEPASIESAEPSTEQTQQGAPWNESDVQKCEGEVFGTFYHITYQSAKELKGGIDETLAKVDASLSPFNKQSTITAINNNTSMETDSMFAEVFNLSKKVSAATDGAFDITVAPLVNLWGFGFKNIDNVSESKVDSLLKFVGIDNVSLVDGKIQKKYPETMLDCSAIAKGYGVDAVGVYLESQGVKNYMVEIGGEVRVRGNNPRGLNWKIAINKPKDNELEDGTEIQEVISVTQLSMATSGNYRNFYMKDGKKFAHTIDPRTGYPVQHSILSSTVLTTDCATADAFATSFMVLGLDKAKEVLKKHKELMVFFVYTDENGEMKEWYSDELKSLIENR